MSAAAWVVATLLLAVSGYAAEPPAGELSAVRLIRLVGHPGAPRERAAAAELTLEVRGRTVRFQTERVDVLRGNVLGADVLAELAPYRPSLRLRGGVPILRKLEESSAWDVVEIAGYHRPGSRDLLVSDIQVTRAGSGKADPTAAGSDRAPLPPAVPPPGHRHCPAPTPHGR